MDLFPHYKKFEIILRVCIVLHEQDCVYTIALLGAQNNIPKSPHGSIGTSDTTYKFCIECHMVLTFG